MADRIKFRDQLKKLVEDKEDAVNKLKFEVNNHRNKVKMISGQLEIAEEKLRYVCDEIDTVVGHH